MNKNIKSLIFGLFGAILFLGVGGYGIRKYLYPFGHRPATLLCMEQSLREYAADHNGFFPYSDLGAPDALRKLYPQYASAFELAGITGDQNALKSILELGKPVDSSITSWVYFPGINQNDSPDLAILYEAHKGILPNGRRASTPVHIVLFNSPASIKLIPDSEWNKFLSQQESLRKKTFEVRPGELQGDGQNNPNPLKQRD